MHPPHGTSAHRHAVAWATAHAGESLTDLSDAVRTQIRALVVHAFTEDIALRQLVAEIMPWLTVSPAEQTGLTLYHTDLQAKGYSGECLDQAVERCQRRFLRAQGQLIMRREVSCAFNNGKLLSWQEAARHGWLDRAHTWREWIGLKDDPSCRHCWAMDGQRVRLDEPFQTPVGPRWTPPLCHTCRCAMGLAFDP